MLSTAKVEIDLESKQEKRAELLDRIRDGKKVKLTWLETVCMTTIEEILEIANEFNLTTDEDGYIYASDDEAIRKMIDDEIEQVEQDKLIDFLRQATYLEHELPIDQIKKIETQFESEGFKFKKDRKGIITKDILTIDPIGVRVQNGDIIICSISWDEIKNITLASHKEEEFTIQQKKKEPRVVLPSNPSFLFDYSRGLGYTSKQLFHIRPSKIKSELKSYNSILISAQNSEEDIWIETTRFKSAGKRSFPKELDAMVYLIEHFFHKIKRDVLIKE